MMTMSPARSELLDALWRWRTSSHYSAVEWSEWCLLEEASSSSCAQLTIKVGHHGEDLDRCVGDLGELLRLVELLTRPGVDTLAFHRLTGRRDATQCPLGDVWCSFCDGVDSRVVLELRPKPAICRGVSQMYLTVLRRAIFEWDDAMATPRFHDVRDAVRRVIQAQQGAIPTTRSRPIELSISLAPEEVDLTGLCRQELQTLRDCCTQTRDTAVNALFQIISLVPRSLDPSMTALIAASQLPMLIEELFEWKDLLRQGSQETGDEAAKTSVLATGNVIKLNACAYTQSCTSPLVERLYQVLQAHSPQLKALTIIHGDGLNFFEYDYNDEKEIKRAPEMQVIARSLFGPDSKLRLDRLMLTAPINEGDLKHMIAVFDPQAPSVAPADAIRHRSITLWGGELSTLHGATLANLLSLTGGVESLELGGSSSEGFRIAEIRDLVRGCRSLRSLTVETTCSGWKNMHPPVVVDVENDSHIQCLQLRIGDRKSALITRAVERLLCHVGRSLVSLSVLPRRSSATLKAKLAAVIAQQCPNLVELTVRNAEDDFIEQLFDSYTKQPCRLKRLSLVTGDADVEYDALMAVLSTPTHPVSRVLRSLHIDVRGWDDDYVGSLSTRLQQLLTTNVQLRDVTLCASKTWPPDDDDASTAGGWSVNLPPLRQRLATLSVLRRINLPVSIVESMLSMAGRRVRRYRLERKDDDDDEDDEEEEDDDD